jgi:hypothetical protein
MPPLEKENNRLRNKIEENINHAVRTGGVLSTSMKIPG